MAENQISAEVRTDTGKGTARKLRAAGRIPAVCYGRNNESQAISLDPRPLDALLRSSASGMNTLIDLEIAGGAAYVGKKFMVKELQRDPVTNIPLHADFYAIDLTHKIEVAVPIHVRGTAPGVSLEGGILDQVLREVHLECLPDSIPDEIVADVSSLQLGMSIHVRDLPLPAGVELRSDADLSVISVVTPKAMEEEAPAAEAAAEGEVAEGAAPEPGEAPSKEAEGKSED